MACRPGPVGFTLCRNRCFQTSYAEVQALDESGLQCMPMLIRFCIYGLLGWCFEVVWSATTEKAWGKQRDWRLVGHTYLWMFPIYGLLAPLGEPVHNFLRAHFWLWRGIAYLLGIWVIEFVTGWVLRKLTAKCPWDYSNLPGNVRGLIALEYAPVWFVFGLAFERVHDALLKITPALQAAFGWR